MRAEQGAIDEAIEAARAARLRYSNDFEPGIIRRKAGKGFTYKQADGTRPDDDTIARIRALAIPPAWTEVWICQDARGHIQATGRDARGRKQYRYHQRWREVRDQAKFDKLLEFGQALPRVRRRIERDLEQPAMPYEKVIATVIRLLEATLVRVGNEEYATQNESYGLTTLRVKHVEKRSGGGLRLVFNGKGGKPHTVEITSPRLAKAIRKLEELPGQRLFQWIDDEGQPHPIDSDDVNRYLREAAEMDVTAKDFRTWMGTVLAATVLSALEPPSSPTAGKRAVNQALKAVASQLNNTVAVCRSSYVHPQVIESYLDGSLPDLWARSASKSPAGLIAEERRLLNLLRTFRRRSTTPARKAA